MTDDFCVIGGGIVGLSTALHLLTVRPGASLVLLESEPALARHQTGHNSGVIHSGIYHAPGSLKARLCREGTARVRELAAEHGIPVDTCGKLLVATTPAEAIRLDALVERAAVNGVAVHRLGAAALRELEPNVDGIAAALVPSTGIVDYVRVSETIGAEVEARGGRIVLGTRVTAITERVGRVDIVTTGGSWAARRVVACGGLQADRLPRLAGLRPDFRVVPFRGEYFRLPADRCDLVSHLVYPVPDPALPVLGVHLTRTVDGGLTVGPNAVLGMARDDYRKGAFSLRDTASYLAFPGMWRFGARHARVGVKELRNSVLRGGYLRECRRFCPDLSRDDLLPAPAGIRAQVIAKDGGMVDDFRFLRTERTVHVVNAPSPAATAALPIGAHIADVVTGTGSSRR